MPKTKNKYEYELPLTYFARFCKPTTLEWMSNLFPLRSTCDILGKRNPL